MEINNSYSQNLYQKSSSTKKVDEDSNSDILSIFEKLIDKSKATDIKNSAYFETSNIPSTSSVTYEKPTPVKWEDQLVYPVFSQPELIEVYKSLKDTDPEAYKWHVQLVAATNGNKYEDAPEFEAFVKKWMDKGESEDIAISRAVTYAEAGLLDYGKQRVHQVGKDLPYGDIKNMVFI